MYDLSKYVWKVIFLLRKKKKKKKKRRERERMFINFLVKKCLETFPWEH